MLSKTKEELLQTLIKDATSQELIWINGFVSGLLASENRGATTAIADNNSALKITILYGSETGNAKSLATRLAASAKKQGIKTKLESAEQYKTASLAKEENLFIVISTQGDGEPPAGAKKFYDFLHNNAPSLSNVKYAVLALGDSSYPMFCKAGEDVDTQLEKLGAQRFASLVKCDTDYETPATQWFEAALKNLTSNHKNNAAVATALPAPAKHTKKIYKGTVSSIINLNDKDSDKETYHIEIDVEDIVYQPGDSIGILPLNSNESVNEIIGLLNAKADDTVSYKDEETTLFDVLHARLNIAYLPERTVRKYAALTNQQIPDTKISLNDLLKIYPLSDNVSVEDVIKILEPLTPRLYSISSSPSAHNDSVHITVSRHRFRLNDSEKHGLCSNYLSGFDVDQELEFYVHPNNSFRLPEDDRDVIMIGPGTGIAPFRSFLFERDAAGTGARNWLFFGDQHFTSDFLYQTEIQSFLETGVLTKFNGAFSRDQKEKIYVQHKMQQNGKELVEWIDNGAIIYICGAKEPMSYDVEKALLEIIAKEKNIDETQAANYFEQLKESGRLVKDVY